MSVLVIGFCDIPDKPRGLDSCVFFRQEDRFIAGAPPKSDELRAYAIERGYFPSGKQGAHPAKCDAIYYLDASRTPESGPLP